MHHAHPDARTDPKEDEAKVCAGCEADKPLTAIGHAVGAFAFNEA